MTHSRLFRMLVRRSLPILLLGGTLLSCNFFTQAPVVKSPPAKVHSTPSPFIPSAPVTPMTTPVVNIIMNTAWEDLSLFEQNLVSEYHDSLADLTRATVYHLAFQVMDPPNFVTGTEDVRYTNQEKDPLNEVEFAVFSEILGGSIVIKNPQVNGFPANVTHRAGILSISLLEPLVPGDSVVIHMEFEVFIPTRGGDFYYGIFGFNEGILSLAHSYPTILVYNENGWNDQVPDLDGDPLFSDASFYLVSVDAPSDLVIVASGKEIARIENNGRQQLSIADGPARDFYLVASRNFNIQSRVVGETIINSYTLPDQVQRSQNILAVAENAILDFSDRYGSYPYTEFDIVPIETSAGGVEFPGMTSVASDVYGDAEFLEIVVVHEIGHQWFYNLVGNATQDQPWLDESIAEFVTWQYFLDRYGQQGAQSYREELKFTWDMLADQKLPIGMPVASYSSDGYVAIIYGRGAFFLLALRERMGVQNFDQFMLDYAESYQWNIATTSGFKLIAETSCGCDLTSLFAEWVDP